jgi:preprotein translocase subunit SecG
MQTIMTVVHVFLAIGVIGLVLMQHGKGADAGAAFGSGASGTVFGAQGASNFLSRTTAILATLFFVTSIALGYFSMQRQAPIDLMKGVTGKPESPVLAPAPASDADIPLIQGENTGATDIPVVDDLPVVVTETPATVDKPEASAFVPAVQENQPAQPAEEQEQPSPIMDSAQPPVEQAPTTAPPALESTAGNKP